MNILSLYQTHLLEEETNAHMLNDHSYPNIPSNNTSTCQVEENNAYGLIIHSYPNIYLIVHSAKEQI